MPISLSISTWNISQSEAKPHDDIWQKSAASPLDFNSNQAIDSISDTIISWKSDIVILQEFPTKDAWCYLGLESLYVGGGFCAQSHCGFTTILLSRKILINFKVYALDIVGPTVIISICERQHPKNIPHKITLIGGHLSPFKNGNRNRLCEITEAIKVAECHKGTSIIFGGDLNMRNEEMINVKKIGLRDAFIELGSPKDASVTWDSFRNKYHHEGFQFSCRFDRFLFSGNVNPVCIKTNANTPVNGKEDHYLSDHFAVQTEWMFG